jgi:hypothetical protein
VSRTTFTRYVALGDSLTEGLCDRAPGHADAFLGWADRLAGILDGDARLAGASLEFANLAVRGRRIADVVDAQIPHALDLRPDLVSVMIGGNDLMSPAADPDALATRLEAGIRDLRPRGRPSCSPTSSIRNSPSSSSRSAGARPSSTRTSGASRGISARSCSTCGASASSATRRCGHPTACT